MLFLSLVDLDLSKVRAHGEVGREVRRDAVFHIAADAPREIVCERGLRRVVRGYTRNRVGLELDVRSSWRYLQANEGAGGRYLRDAAKGRGRPGNLREVRLNHKNLTLI